MTFATMTFCTMTLRNGFNCYTQLATTLDNVIPTVTFLLLSVIMITVAILNVIVLNLVAFRSLPLVPGIKRYSILVGYT
jgi:hypothetical protein